MKNRVLVFRKVSAWIMVIILPPTLFLHCEPVVSHSMENACASFSSILWRQICFAINVSPVFFLKRKLLTILLFVLGRKAYELKCKPMYCNLFHLFIFFNHPPPLVTCPSGKAEWRNIWLEEKSWETHSFIYLESTATVGWWLLQCKAVTSQNWAKNSMQGWRKRNREQTGMQMVLKYNVRELCENL